MGGGELRRELVFMGLFLLILVPAVDAQTFEPQVGAWGDDASRENIGVRVEIRTNIYSVAADDFQYFWVGDNLDNGAFVQFGYAYEPGYYCLRGQTIAGTFTCLGDSANIGLADARWEWQYWSNENGKDFSYEIGPLNSAGLNGTWHDYSIMPNVVGGWSFALDGRQVSYITDAWTKSKDPAYFIAEKGSDSSVLGQLGPVQFRNLAYLKDDGWHYAMALYARVGCAVSTNCSINNPYGVMSEGSGVVIAGSGIPQPRDLDLLWTSGVTLTLDLPKQVVVNVDRKYVQSGYSQVSLSPGLHTIMLPQVVATNAKSRLRFDHWSDGVMSPNRTIILNSDTTLRATYVTQYLLTIDSVVPLGGSGWYDQASTASFTAPISTPIYSNLGILGGQRVFTGWYDDGTYLTNSPTSTMVMNRPHSLQARWHEDYVVPIGIAILLMSVIAVVLVLKLRGKGPAQPPTVARQKPERMTDSMIYCIECRSTLPAGSKFCEKCGAKQT